jgi:hypothetical protein
MCGNLSARLRLIVEGASPGIFLTGCIIYINTLNNTGAKTTEKKITVQEKRKKKFSTEECR